MNNGFSTEEDSRGGHADQTCCLIDENERCRNTAGNASYSKRIQKTVSKACLLFVFVCGLLLSENTFSAFRWKTNVLNWAAILHLSTFTYATITKTEFNPLAPKDDEKNPKTIVMIQTLTYQKCQIFISCRWTHWSDTRGTINCRHDQEWKEPS